MQNLEYHKKYYQRTSSYRLTAKHLFSFLLFSIFSVSLCSASSLILLFSSLQSSSRCATSFLSTSALNEEEQTSMKQKEQTKILMAKQCFFNKLAD